MAEGYFFDRRDILKLSAVLATPAVAVAAVTQQEEEPEAESLLPNHLPPAVQFQAFPGGTGSLGFAAESLTRGVTIEPWSGDRPETEEEIAFLPVHRLATLIERRKLSPVELTSIYLSRLKRLDEKLLCAVNLMEESATAAAQKAEQEIREGNYRGPLHGIPCGVNDLFSVAGTITTWGAKPYENRVIDEDAEIVRRLEEAGAILIAKLSTGTFAQGDRWYRGMTRNPWNLEQGSSGSSAGPGSATAAGCVGFSIGTETRGSIVSPSRRCALSALRPTFGRVSRHGCMTLSWSMDKVGPMCRSIADCALVFDAIHGADEKDATTVSAPFRFEQRSRLDKLKIGFTPDSDEAFVNSLRDLGAEVVELPARPDWREVGEILGVESATAFDDFISRNMDEEMIRKVRVAGFRRLRSVTALDYLNAQRRRTALMREMDRFMQDVDLYVSPSGDLALTNLTGHPSAVLPYTFDGSRPQCLTLVGRLFQDDLLLSVANAYQATTDWHLRVPPL